MQHPQAGLNPLLTAPPTGTTHFRPVHVQWDVRHSPRHTARVVGRLISSQQLTQLAMSPVVQSLRVVSDLLFEDWVIAAYNPAGVTVENVFDAIHRGLRVPLTPLEWERMSPTQQTRIETTFYQRCEASRDFERTRSGGVRRIDCLLHTTVFAGFSSLLLTNSGWEVVLTLSRDFSARSRARDHPDA